jgi:hypothetical protein
MATQTAILPSLVPPTAAPAILEYPQFTRVSAPAGSDARSAWQGTIQPFADDLTAKQVLRRIESGAAFENDAGSLLCEQPPVMTPHPADRFLMKMDMRFKILVLELPQFEHPCAYLLSPELSPQYLSFHPHTRRDCSITIANHRIPALCVYSGAIFQFEPDTDRMVQFLDQVATYLARHAIWLRTRVLLRCNVAEKDTIEDRPSPGEMIVDAETVQKTFDKKPGELYWNGYWPGKAAPSGTSEHLATIKPNRPCWCWSGKPYKDCHRPLEVKISARIG